MNWISYPLGSSTSEFRTLAEIKNDIDDELEFHIQSRIEDLRAEGLTHQQAETAARAAFGSQASIRKQCQLINFGTRIWLRRFVVTAISGCLLAIAFLGYQLVNERNRNHQLLIQLQQASAEYSDVTGMVLDSDDRPVPDADVYITIKTWPNNRFHQEQFVTRTDSKGAFRYPELLPIKKSYAVNISIHKQGYAFASTYSIKQSERPKGLDPIVMKLHLSDPVTLYVKHANDKPARDFPIVIYARFDGSEEHVVYDLGDSPLALQTDENGMLEIPFVRDTDELEIGFQASDGSGLRTELVSLNGKSTTLVVDQVSLQNSY